MYWANVSHATNDKIRIFNMCWPKSSLCQREHKMHLNLCWQNLLHAWNAFQYVSTKPIPCQIENKMHLHFCWPNPTHVGEETKFISTCVEKTHPMTDRTQNVSQHVLTKSLLCQRGHKEHLNMCWSYLSHASNEEKCISSFVDQTHSMPAKICNESQHVLNKPISCPSEHKTPPMTPTTQNESQHVLRKPIPWQRGNKMYLNLCWPKPSHASIETKCMSTVFSKHLPSQEWDKIYLTLLWPNISHASEVTKCNSCWQNP